MVFIIFINLMLINSFMAIIIIIFLTQVMNEHFSIHCHRALINYHSQISIYAEWYVKTLYF